MEFPPHDQSWEDLEIRRSKAIEETFLLTKKKEQEVLKRRWRLKLLWGIR